MKHIIDHALRQWKNDKYRKPLLLRGARQVGKTFAIALSKSSWLLRTGPTYTLRAYTLVALAGRRITSEEQVAQPSLSLSF